MKKTEFKKRVRKLTEQKLVNNPDYQSRTWQIDLGIVVEYEVLKTINIYEFVMLARIDGLIKHGRGCYASNKWFAERQGCSERQVQRIIQSLKEKGFIEIKVKKYGETKTKRLIWTKWSPRKSLAKMRPKLTKSCK